MDATDFAIYRYLSRDGLARFWASRRLVDPRVSAREIAEKVGLSEAGVRARLRALHRQGLLGSSAVGVNPSVLGAALFVVEIPVRTPRESDRLFRDLEVTDGVVFARDLLDEDDRTLSVYFGSGGPAETSRRVALLRRLSPAGGLRGPAPYWIPPCERALSPLDWKLLRLFRRDPDGSLAHVASAAGLSLKTTARRFGQLVGSRACWWSHSSESAEWPLALLTLSVGAGASTEGVVTDVADRCESWMPVAPDGLGTDPVHSPPRVAGLVPVGTPSALEATVRRILEIDGVVELRRTFGLRSAAYPHWVDDRLEARSTGRV